MKGKKWKTRYYIARVEKLSTVSTSTQERALNRRDQVEGEEFMYVKPNEYDRIV